MTDAEQEAPYEPLERDIQTARRIVKQCGIRDGLFKGARITNAVDAIAMAITSARSVTSDYQRGRQSGIEDGAKVAENHFANHNGDQNGVIHLGQCHQAIAADIRALLPAAKLSPWMPIESAPKDGTPILILFADGAIAKAKWADVDWDEWTQKTCYDWECIGCVFSEHDEQPTHWLPEPPVAEEE